MRAGWKWIVAGLLLTPLMALADVAPPDESDDALTELEQAEEQEAAAPSEMPPGVKPGPAKVDLGHDLALDVPEEHVFLDKPVAAKVLEQNGSFYHDNLLGIVVSKDEKAPWFVVIRYEDEGYIKDDEELDAKEILDAIKEGQEEANEENADRPCRLHPFPSASDTQTISRSLRTNTHLCANAGCDHTTLRPRADSTGSITFALLMTL